MAKLNAPLLSFGASGAIAKAIVYFPWKGLNVARQYVIPSNPKTGPQTTQRGYLTSGVAKVHAMMLHGNPLLTIDKMAYALWGSTYPTPRTWFNQAIKNWLDQLRKTTGLAAMFHYGILTPGTDLIKFYLHTNESGAVVTTIDLYVGTSKTALIKKQSTTRGLLMAGVDITGLETGVKYFIQARPTAPAGYDGVRSGIYYGVPL